MTTVVDHRHGKSGASLRYAEHGVLIVIPLPRDLDLEACWEASSYHDRTLMPTHERHIQ